MKAIWRKSKATWGHHKLIELSSNMNGGIVGTTPEHETCLSGYHGEIWQASANTFSVVLSSTTRARAFAKLIGAPLTCQRGDEPILTFQEKHLPAAVLAIRIPSSQATRARLANGFGK